MTTLQWAVTETLTNCLTTELNSLADGSQSSLSAAVDNTTDRYENIVFELNLASLTPASGGYMSILLVYALGGTNYETTGVSYTHALVAALPLDSGASTKRVSTRRIELLPFKFKVLVESHAGASLAASGNTLAYSRFKEEAV